MATTSPGPPSNVRDVPSVLLKRARATLGLNQAQAADLLYTSRRNIIRWEQGAAFSAPAVGLRELARLAVARDLGLATELATLLGGTLESLGLVAPSPPQASPEVQASPPLVLTPLELANVALFAGAEAAAVSPQVVRAAVHAVLAKAEALGLSLDALKAATGTPP